MVLVGQAAMDQSNLNEPRSGNASGSPILSAACSIRISSRLAGPADLPKTAAGLWG
jgi:hypothetical protein